VSANGSTDKDLFVRTRRAVALLADQPYPETATVYIIKIGVIS